MNDIKGQVRQYFLDNFLFGASDRMPADSHSFMEHQLLDSTGFLELVLFLEEQFDMKVGDEEMIPEHLDSFDAIAAFVARKCESSPT